MNHITQKYLDNLTYEIVGACIEVHKQTGPGLLESIYHSCLVQEMNLRKLNFQSKLSVQVIYKGLDMGAKLKCDFLVEGIIALELKAVETLNSIFEAQLLTYMKLLKVPKGILVNFNCKNIFETGQKTYVNELFRALPKS